MPLNENDVEAAIKARGLNAPRLTPDQIDAKIVARSFHVFPGTTVTVCGLTLENGFVVVGTSAAASPENFNRELGEKIAFDKARDKVWELEGYLLRERLTGK